jgi:hypothetical protein
MSANFKLVGRFHIGLLKAGRFGIVSLTIYNISKQHLSICFFMRKNNENKVLFVLYSIKPVLTQIIERKAKKFVGTRSRTDTVA